MLATGLLLIQSESSHGQLADGAARLQLVAFAVGVLLVLLGLQPMVRTRRWNARAYRTTGCVVDHVYLGRRLQRVHAPVVEFDLGEAHVRFLDSDVGHDDWPVGARVPVLYDPDNPRQAHLAGFKATPSWWLVAGLAALVTGLVVI
jgi:hypothetical protein